MKGDVREELLLREDEVYAWKELRLHPLLIKSIRRLGFREPTPIQKACIPAAAHQGKVGLLLYGLIYPFVFPFKFCGSLFTNLL